MRARSASRISSRDLPTPEKTTDFGLRSGALQAVKFADRDDVESAAQPRQQAQDGKIGVGFDRIADRVRQAPKRLVELAIGAGDAGGAINVGRSSDARGDLLQRHAFAIKVIAAPGKFGRVARGIDRRRRGGVQAPRGGPANSEARSPDFHHHERAVVGDRPRRA